MSNEHAKQMGSGRMDGPTLVYTATSQASAAGGATQYAFVSCYGAKSITFFVRTAAGIPSIASSTIDIDLGIGSAPVTGVGNSSHNIQFTTNASGEAFIIPGDNANMYGKTDLRFPYDRIALRGQLSISATGVSCWAVTQWD